MKTGTNRMSDDYEPRANMAFGMPASWEDMEALGLDPLTGEPSGDESD